MLDEFAASLWFRTLFPIVVGLVYELGTRYARKGPTPFAREDWFFALPALGAAIVALPPLTALYVTDVETDPGIATTDEAGAVTEIVAFGGLIVAALVMIAFIFAAFDRRVLMRRRATASLGMSILVTWVPNAFAVGVAIFMLWIVAP